MFVPYASQSVVCGRPLVYRPRVRYPSLDLHVWHSSAFGKNILSLSRCSAELQGQCKYWSLCTTRMDITFFLLLLVRDYTEYTDWVQAVFFVLFFCFFLGGGVVGGRGWGVGGWGERGGGRWGVTSPPTVHWLAGVSRWGVWPVKIFRFFFCIFWFFLWSKHTKIRTCFELSC